jgi:hypothetical protein
MTATIDEGMLAKLSIREVIERWAIARDTGDFESLRACFHDDGIMFATWFQGSADDFVGRALTSFSRGNMSSHILGGISIEIAGSRAVAQTRLTLAAREQIEGALYDISCIGRFYDLFEKRAGGWKIAERRLTYEKDRAEPVLPGETHAFDRALLDSFPPGYRFLAYAQTKRGLAVKTDLPGLRGPDVEALYARGKAWLNDHPWRMSPIPAQNRVAQASKAACPAPPRSLGRSEAMSEGSE